MIDPGIIHNANILVVDDCEDNIFLLSEILRETGYSRITCSTKSTEVCALHAKNDYDLILLDMQMPDMNGIEVMQGLKEIEVDGYLPVLAITGDQEYKIAALKSGARDFLTKPYDLVEFQMRIRNLLEVRLLYKTVAEQSRVQTEMALHDSLTGLPNRRLLLDRMEKAMQHARRNQQQMAVLFMDLDGFKEVNDRHGHQCGDQLLKIVADRLQTVTRQEDTVARIGGDEFIMVLSHNANIGDIMQTASKVLKYLARPFSIGSLTIRVTASIGVAMYPANGEDAELLMARADNALYEAKRLGKNCYYFSHLPAEFAIAS